MSETDPRERSWSRFGILVEEILITLDKGVTTPIQGFATPLQGGHEDDWEWPEGSLVVQIRDPGSVLVRERARR